jgi:hypothetical protein
MEVGIEDCLHIEFEYERGAYALADTVLGRIHFLLVRRGFLPRGGGGGARFLLGRRRFLRGRIHFLLVRRRFLLGGGPPLPAGPPPLPAGPHPLPAGALPRPEGGRAPQRQERRALPLLQRLLWRRLAPRLGEQASRREPLRCTAVPPYRRRCASS